MRAAREGRPFFRLQGIKLLLGIGLCPEQAAQIELSAQFGACAEFSAVRSETGFEAEAENPLRLGTEGQGSG